MGGGGCGGKTGPNAGAVTPQPFFEAALKGTGYCGNTSCTAAVVANEGATGNGNITLNNVWSLWSDLDGGVGCPTTGCTGPGGDAFNFPRTMMNTPIPGSAFGGSGQLSSGVAVNASVGYGNYNAGFVTLKTSDWKGVSMQENFTWSKALGTGAVVQASSAITPDDPYNLSQMYGRQSFDRKYVYTMYLVYQPPFFKGQSGACGTRAGRLDIRHGVCVWQWPAHPDWHDRWKRPGLRRSATPFPMPATRTLFPCAHPKRARLLQHAGLRHHRHRRIAGEHFQRSSSRV